MVKGAVAPAREEHERQKPPDPGEDARHGTSQRVAAEVLGTATRERLLGPQAAIPVGATVAVDGLLGASSSGAAMNPARALAPALSWGTWPVDGWVYLVGPFAGALVATVVAFCVFGGPRAEEHKAAVGSEGKEP